MPTGSSSFVSPLTTKGDVFGYSTANARVGVGTNGNVLKADSSAATGVSWGAFSNIAGGTYALYTVSSGAGSAVGQEIVASHTGTAGSIGLYYANTVLTSPATLQFDCMSVTAQAADSGLEIGATNATTGSMVVTGDGFMWMWQDNGAGFGRFVVAGSGTNVTLTGAVTSASRLWRKMVWTSGTTVVWSEQSAVTGQYVQLASNATLTLNQATLVPAIQGIANGATTANGIIVYELRVS